MKKRIELERRGRSPAEIEDLNLDPCRSTHITGLTDEYCNLESLSLRNVGLTTLEGFPKLPNLKKLDLCGNLISGDLHWLHGSPKLVCLYLRFNKIKDIEKLVPLGQLKNLKSLDLFGCEVSLIQNYRNEIFGFISSLTLLDGYRRNNKEADGSEAKINNNDADHSSSFSGINIMESKTSLCGKNYRQKVLLASELFEPVVTGITSCTAACRSSLFSCLPVTSVSEFSFGNTTQSNPFVNTTGKTSFTDIARNTSGTTTEFNPVIGCDEMMMGGVITTISTKFQVITEMKEYANKSFEELRVEDYASNRKGVTPFARATEYSGLVTCLPTSSISDIAILQKHFKDLLLSGDDHDVTIKIKNHEYKAHKSILRARSPVFSAMFKHQMKENVDNSISVEDCDAEDFGKFLQYIYTGEVENLSPSSSLNLYYAGDKYQVSGLKETCVNFLKFTLSTANICGVITLATKHNEADLLQGAISFFSKHLEEIVITVDWQRFLTENPTQANELYIKAIKTSYKKIS